MRRVGLLAVITLPACLSVPAFGGDVSINDEDVDGIPNDQDLCPQINSGGGTQVDDDGDGVGNACDPNPGEQDQHFFYSFRNRDIGEMSREGAVTLDDGFVTIGAVGSDAVNGLTLPRTFRKMQVDLRFAIGDTMDTPESGFIVATGRIDADPTHAGFCLLDLDGAGTKVSAVYDPGSGPAADTAPVPDLPFVQLAGHVNAILDGTAMKCVVDQFNTHDPVSVTHGIGGTALAGQAGVYASNTQVALEYLFITGVP